jgi:hypothetical protein
MCNFVYIITNGSWIVITEQRYKKLFIKPNNMPISPGPSETQDQFIGRCISEEISAGYEESQAAAICYSKWDRKELSKQKFSDPQRRVQSKLNYDKKYEGINLTALAENGLEDACWPGYEAIGTKDMGGREVPNCVPIKE